MKVFISYGAAADQVTALRLHALGAVNGLTVYVPPAYTRQGLTSLLDPDAAQKLNEAEVVLGVAGAGLSEACRLELVAFSNLAGGMVLLGVDDDGRIGGLTRADLEEWVMTTCRDKIRPAIIPFFETVRDVEPGRDVAIVSVTRGYDVHSLWHHNSNRYYIRVGTQSREAAPEELARLFQQRGPSVPNCGKSPEPRSPISTAGDCGLHQSYLPRQLRRGLDPAAAGAFRTRRRRLANFAHQYRDHDRRGGDRWRLAPLWPKPKALPAAQRHQCRRISGNGEGLCRPRAGIATRPNDRVARRRWRSG